MLKRHTPAINVANYHIQIGMRAYRVGRKFWLLWADNIVNLTKLARVKRPAAEKMLLNSAAVRKLIYAEARRFKRQAREETGLA